MDRPYRRPEEGSHARSRQVPQASASVMRRSPNFPVLDSGCSMIFRLLSRIVRRAWPVLLVAWGLLLLGVWRAAPRWEDVAQDRVFDFLPADAPSRRAEEVY